MSATRIQPFSQSQLVAALVTAKAAALAAAASTDDGGTCNFDAVVLRYLEPEPLWIKGKIVTTLSLIQEAAKDADVFMMETNWLGQGVRFDFGGKFGQADKRALAAEAAFKVLRDLGFTVDHYQQMD